MPNTISLFKDEDIIALFKEALLPVPLFPKENPELKSASNIIEELTSNTK